VHLSFHAFMPELSANFPYVLQVIISTPEFVEVGPGTSLTLTLDETEQLPLSGRGGCGARGLSRIGVASKEEVTLYPLSQEQLLRIAQAKTVTFTLVGARQTVSGTWNRELVRDAMSLATKGRTVFSEPPPASAPARAGHGEEYSAYLPSLGLGGVERMIDAGRYECAARLLDDVLLVNASARGYYLQGELARRRSDAPESQAEAIAAYERATGFPDVPPDAYRQIGLLRRAQGDHRSAVAALKHYLELAPNAANAPLARQYLQEHEGDSP
jgi:hypothetical protein